MYIYIYNKFHIYLHIGGDLAPSWGDGQIFE